MIKLEQGMIVIWADSIATIPSGFALCDGNNGTPDLRDYFPIGAGGAYNPDDKAGSPTHNHTFTTTGHDHEDRIGGPAFFEATSPDSKLSVESDTGTTNQKIAFPPFHALCYIILL